MTRYIIRRGIQSFFLVWLSTVIGFTIYQMAPGGPIQFLDDDPAQPAKIRIDWNGCMDWIGG